MHNMRNVVAIGAVTFALVFFGLVLQYEAAANAVAVFQTQGITTNASALTVQKELNETGGVASVRLDPSRGMVLAVYDARAVDPRSVAVSLTRKGFPTRINDLMTMEEYIQATSGTSGCGTGGCDNCSKSK